MIKHADTAPTSDASVAPLASALTQATPEKPLQAPARESHPRHASRMGDGPDLVARTAASSALETKGRPLDTDTRTDMESRFGHSFGSVRVHTDAEAGRSALALDASAYAFGSHIAFAPGFYQPQTVGGRTLLAHELAHTLQQGSAEPASQSRLSQPHDAAEREADQAATDAMRRRPVSLSAQPPSLMRNGDKGSMADFVRGARGEMSEFFAYQDRFKELNGREIRNLLQVLEALRGEGKLQGFLDNFDAATGVNRPRLRAAMEAVARKGSISHGDFANDFATDLNELPEDQKRVILEYLGAPAANQPKVGAAAQAPSAQSQPAAPSNFKTHSYSMSTADTTLVRGRKKTVKQRKGKPDQVTAGRKEIKESPEHFTAEILKQAGLDPVAWYQSFTSISFLGFTVSDVHIDLATHLKTVEQQFADQYGGDQKDPGVAGKTLGLKQDIGGGRHAPTGTGLSMHLFGLAIDVNYDTNPWVVEDPQSQSGQDENALLARATLLVDGASTQFAPNAMSYDQIAALNQSVKTYFSYIDDRAALEEKLKTATGSWAGKSTDDAAKQVQADFDKLAQHWERSDPKYKGAIKTGGFMDLQKNLVDGMGLDWGGKYGDMMHFDMRNKGSGAKIDRARNAYKAQKVAESEKKYSEEEGE